MQNHQNPEVRERQEQETSIDEVKFLHIYTSKLDAAVASMFWTQRLAIETTTGMGIKVLNDVMYVYIFSVKSCF